MAADTHLSQGSNKALSLLRALALIGLLVVFAQTYLQAPERRAETLCWPGYKTVRFTVVTVPDTLAPWLHDLTVGNAAFATDTYRTCIHYARGLPGFRAPKANPKPPQTD